MMDKETFKRVVTVCSTIHAEGSIAITEVDQPTIQAMTDLKITVATGSGHLVLAVEARSEGQLMDWLRKICSPDLDAFLPSARLEVGGEVQANRALRLVLPMVGERRATIIAVARTVKRPFRKWSLILHRITVAQYEEVKSTLVKDGIDPKDPIPPRLRPTQTRAELEVLSLGLKPHHHKET